MWCGVDGQTGGGQRLRLRAAAFLSFIGRCARFVCALFVWPLCAPSGTPRVLEFCCVPALPACAGRGSWPWPNRFGPWAATAASQSFLRIIDGGFFFLFVEGHFLVGGWAWPPRLASSLVSTRLRGCDWMSCCWRRVGQTGPSRKSLRRIGAAQSARVFK